MDLFDHAFESRRDNEAPLAERMRPRNLDEVVGQAHLLAPGKVLRRAIEQDRLFSMLFWGPPGTGKTTIARCIANASRSQFVTLSAVLAGVADIRAAVTEARRLRREHGRRTILFVDEIHRFNKGQQDALLPHVEDGTVLLIGATTENPSFEVNSALLSRVRVFTLNPLSPEDLVALARRALTDPERGLAKTGVTATDDVLASLVAGSYGDARRVLTVLEVCAQFAEGDAREAIVESDVEQALQHRTLLYDKSGEEHYNVVSAFIKSMRGSNPDAAVYWLVRMLEAGEEPRFLLRRMVIFASEDIGNADPQALILATAALQSFELIGLPEGVLPMTQLAAYLACAEKSNASYAAYKAARAEVKTSGPLAVPMHLRNAPTSLMKKLGYGKDYKYPHSYEGHHVAETYLPNDLIGRRFYTPSAFGKEREFAARLARLHSSSPGASDDHAPDDHTHDHASHHASQHAATTHHASRRDNANGDVKKRD